MEDGECDKQVNGIVREIVSTKNINPLNPSFLTLPSTFSLKGGKERQGNVRSN